MTRRRASRLTTPRRRAVAAGAFVLAGLAAGVLSVVPVLERPDYLAHLVDSEAEVLRGALFQVVMVPCYLGFALSLYPTVRRGSRALSLGFVGLRLVAVTSLLTGAVLLPLLLELGRASDATAPADVATLETVAEALRRGRDLVNHVAVIVPLSLADGLLFAILHQWRLVPRWLSVWGLVGAGLSASGSLFVLGGAVEVVGPLYLSLNAPMAAQSLALAAWLTGKGLDTTSLDRARPRAGQD